MKREIRCKICDELLFFIVRENGQTYLLDTKKGKRQGKVNISKQMVGVVGGHCKWAFRILHNGEVEQIGNVW